MLKPKIKSIVLLLLVFSIANSQNSKVSIQGELKKWHKITLSFTGEPLSEYDKENPFLNYRLNVTFKNKDKIYIVPGFYAADGNASETSADKGNIWQVRFSPDEMGEWEYTVSFRQGEQIAISDDIYEGTPVSFDGTKGTFTIEASDKMGDDFRAKGRLNYVGERYLQFADTKDYFLKGGADSPESFLAYYEFDQTPASHKFEPHARDWNDGDPTWQNGKGKNIMGALNYLASKGMNAVYFLTMNVQGDGKDVWPWTDMNERYRFDCSKLDQWEKVFDHMDKLGLMMHIVTQETENELLLDIGETGVQRKLYYRELIARFSHHLGITWNLGEENGPLSWTPKGQTDNDRKDMAKYIKTHDPYHNLVVLHTHAEPKAQDLFLTPLLGYAYLDGPSMQTHDINDIHDITKKWIKESKEFGQPWVVCQDEIGPADTGAKPDADDPEHNEIRSKVLWANLMAGGAGVEWYFGYKFAHNDLKCEDWRSRDILWDQTKYALDFFQKHIPFKNMMPADDLTDNPSDYVFVDIGNTYAIYFPEVNETTLDLSANSSKFTIKWYNPRTGGELQDGSIKSVKGGGMINIGVPPNKEKDWVALIQAKRGILRNKESNPIILGALTHFEIDNSNKVVYYQDKNKMALAINAGKKEQRLEYASAKVVFDGETGMYTGFLNTLTEHDGESSYYIKINNDKRKIVSNPETNKAYELVKHNLGKLYISKSDTIEVFSNAVTNGKIPENDGTAWSRGRWTSLELQPDSFNLRAMLKNVSSYEEKDGILEVEAENYHDNTNNHSPRKWYKRVKDDGGFFEKSTNHSDSASSGAYIEAMPDTRVTHSDKLIPGENFFSTPGTGGIVSYKVKINNPGKYYVWVSAFSTGAEDNGLHVGIDGQWPESGQRIQLCSGKGKWTWSSAQRVPSNHCGIPMNIYLDIKEAGEHIISFSMREDGFELDRFLLTSNPDFTPK